MNGFDSLSKRGRVKDVFLTPSSPSPVSRGEESKYINHLKSIQFIHEPRQGFRN